MRHYKKLSALKVAVALAAFAAASCPTVHAQATALPQVAELSTDPLIHLPGGGDASPFAFGSAVAISGDGNTMVVGAGAGGYITVSNGTTLFGGPTFKSYPVDYGAIHIFTKQGSGWTKAGVISAPDGTQGFDSFGVHTEFGYSVAVNYDGSVVVAGGPKADSDALYPCALCFDGGDGGGAVYVYARPQGGWTDNLPYSARLTNSDGHYDDRLGNSVAISNDGTIVVAAAPSVGFVSGSAIGEAYLYVQPPGGWAGNLTETARFNNPDSVQDGFALSIAISGDGKVVVISAAYGPKAYIYKEGPIGWQTPGGGFYSAITYLQPSDGAPNDYFGQSVAMNADGSLIVIGSPNPTPDAILFPGPSKAYVYYDAYGWTASSANAEAQQLTISSVGACSQFGNSVSVTPDGATILVGDSNQGEPVNRSCLDSNDLALGSGAAYIFTQAPCGALCPPEPYYILTAKATATDASAGNQFGFAVAISGTGDNVLAGAPYGFHVYDSLSTPHPSAGKVYVFTQAAMATLSSTSLNFNNQPVGTTSIAQKVTLTNTGSKPLSITVEGIDPGFQFQGGTPNCLPRSPIAPGASCDEYIAFAPTNTGSITGTLSLQDNSGNVPGTQQTVSLSGTAILASTTTTITAVAPSPAVVGQTVTVTFSVGWGTNTFNPSGNVTVSANTGGSCAGFAVVDNCTLSFSTYGTRMLTAMYSGDSHFNGSTSSQVMLNVGDFSISAVPTAITIPIGGSGSTQVTVGSLGGFNSAVSLAVSGAPSGVMASVSPSPVTPPSGGSTSPSTLSITLGPSITPTSFTFTSSGAYGSLTHSVPITVTAVATPSSTTNVINQLLSTGCINSSGVANAFTSKLSAAQSASNAGNTQLAVNILDALLYQLQAQSGKHLATSCTISGVTFNSAAVLIGDVKSMLATLKLLPNPIIGYVANSSGTPVSGAKVSIVNSTGTVIANATSDAAGFYFFANTIGLVTGTTYTAKIASFPSLYKSSTPASQTFTWLGALVVLNNFTVAP